MLRIAPDEGEGISLQFEVNHRGPVVDLVVLGDSCAKDDDERSDQMIVVVDETKLVDLLGGNTPLPRGDRLVSGGRPAIAKMPDPAALEAWPSVMVCVVEKRPLYRAWHRRSWSVNLAALASS